MILEEKKRVRFILVGAVEAQAQPARELSFLGVAHAPHRRSSLWRLWCWLLDDLNSCLHPGGIHASLAKQDKKRRPADEEEHH